MKYQHQCEAGPGVADMLEPEELMQRLGLEPDRHQLAILKSRRPRLLLNCCRQFGKSTITAVKAVHHAMTQEGATVLIGAPTERQAAELVDKCAGYLRKLEVEFQNDRRHRAGLVLRETGARILGLPNSESSTRGYAATFLIIDEAARVPDEVYTALRPTLAAAKAQDEAPLWLLSTPGAAAGFFHGFATDPEGAADFERFHFTVHDCARIGAATVEQLRRELPPEQFARECMAEFGATQGSMFAPAEIAGAVSKEVARFDFQRSAYRPGMLMAPMANMPRLTYFLGVDFGKSHDHSAVALLELRVSPTGHRDGVTYAPLAAASLELRHLDQFPLGTDYSAVIGHVGELVGHPALAHKTALVFDANGVGAGLYEMLREARLPVQLAPVTYTAGLKVTQKESVYHVPKGTLMTNLQTSFREGYLKVAGDLRHWEELRRELALFERTVTASGHAIYQPGKSPGHDDLLNAVALANWYVHYQHRSRLRRSAAGELYLTMEVGGPLW